MATRAMSLGPVDLGYASDGTSQILRVGHGLQVVRPDASTIPTAMVKFPTIRNRTNKELIRPTMAGG